MEEFLSTQINNHINLLLFDSLMVIIPLVILIFILLNKTMNIWKRLEICLAMVFLMFLAMLNLIPLAIIQVNLIKDSYKPVLVSTEGVFERGFGIAKHSVAVINKEKYILSDEILNTKVEEGKKVKIEYFENSKYIYTLTIEND